MIGIGVLFLLSLSLLRLCIVQAFVYLSLLLQFAISAFVFVRLTSVSFSRKFKGSTSFYQNAQVILRSWLSSLKWVEWICGVIFTVSILCFLCLLLHPLFEYTQAFRTHSTELLFFNSCVLSTSLFVSVVCTRYRISVTRH